MQVTISLHIGAAAPGNPYPVMLILSGLRLGLNALPIMVAFVLLVSLLKVSLLVAGLAVVGWMAYELIIAPLLEDYEDERDL